MLPACPADTLRRVSPPIPSDAGATGCLFVDAEPVPSRAELARVVCVHGSMDRHSSFAKIRSRLIDRCDVTVYDRRGYSRSRECLPPATGVADHARDLEAILSDRPSVVLGHSYGADVALCVASRRPDLVTAVVAFEAPLTWLDFWHEGRESHTWPSSHRPTPEQAAEAFLRRMIGNQRFDRMPSYLRTEVLRNGPAFVAEITGLRRDEAPFVPEMIEVPVVAAYGSETDERHVRASTWLADRIPGAILREVPGAGHDAHRSHPDEVAALVLEAVGLAKAGLGSHDKEPAR